MKFYFIITYKNGEKRVMYGTLEECRTYCEEVGATYQQKNN